MTTATKSRSNNKPAAIAEIDWRATFIEALNAPGALGNTYCRFYNYSFLNQIRLMMQGVMEPVASYGRWQELGRQVQKGSKAKTVLAPMQISKQLTDSNGNPVIVDGKPVKRSIIIGFRDSRTVFGFSDTDGDELPPVELPTWDADQALKTLGVKRIRFRKTEGNKQGYSMENEQGKQVAINPAANYPAKTMLHELAHIVLGHCKALAEGNREMHRGVVEFEAESVAYLVAKELELATWDASESRAYIKHWLSQAGLANQDEVTDKSMGRIFAAANKIITAGRVKAEVA